MDAALTPVVAAAAWKQQRDVVELNQARLTQRPEPAGGALFQPFRLVRQRRQQRSQERLDVTLRLAQVRARAVLADHSPATVRAIAEQQVRQRHPVAVHGVVPRLRVHRQRLAQAQAAGGDHGKLGTRMSPRHAVVGNHHGQVPSVGAHEHVHVRLRVHSLHPADQGGVGDQVRAASKSILCRCDAIRARVDVHPHKRLASAVAQSALDGQQVEHGGAGGVDLRLAQQRLRQFGYVRVRAALPLAEAAAHEVRGAHRFVTHNASNDTWAGVVPRKVQ